MSDKYINTNYSLSTICDFNKYNLSKKDNFINIEYLDTSNITENNINKLIIYDIKHAPSRAKRKVKDKTIIYSTVRPIQKHFGILKNPKDNMIVSTGFITIDLKKEFIHIIDEYYIYYLITQNSITEYLQTIAEGSVSAYPSITSDDIINLRFSFPKIEYQKQIANYLLQIDKKIQLNNLIYSELEKMAKTLYNYWFVQFDFPDENGRPYKSSGGKMVWSEELQREIPYGWEVKKLKDLVLINKNKSQPDCNKFLLDLSVMPSNSFCLQQFSKGDKLSTNIFTMQKFDILFGSIRPYLLKAGFAPTNGLVAGTIHSVKPIDSNLYNYLLLTFCSNSLFNYAIQNSKGSRMPVIGIDDLLDYKIALNKNIMYKFEKSISFKEIIANIIMENQELTSLRDFLLPLLMNGQAVIKE